jgi:hypothetical protein
MASSPFRSFGWREEDCGQGLIFWQVLDLAQRQTIMVVLVKTKNPVSDWAEV